MTLAGRSAREEEARARAAARRLRQKANGAERAAAAWGRGARGEEKCQDLVEPLLSDGYKVLYDRALPDGSNVDCILVGPGGVVVVDVKDWSGTLTISGDRLTQNGFSRSQIIEKARLQARAIADALSTQAGDRGLVYPLLCFVGDAAPASPAYVEKVRLVAGSDLVDQVRSLTTRLHCYDEIAKVATAIEQAFSPRSAAGKRSVRSAAPLVAEKPHDLVLFLIPWQKAGHRRLYVKDDHGRQVGHLDLRTGSYTAADGWDDVIVQLLPHFLMGDTPGLREADLTDEARGAIGKFLDLLRGQRHRRMQRTLVVAYRWKRSGKDRLYVKRLEPGRVKAELGWVDSFGNDYKVEQRGAEGVLGYCQAAFGAWPRP